MHEFGIEEVRIQDKLLLHKPIKMTKTCLFLPAINIEMIRNALQHTGIKETEMKILRRKRGL